LWEASLDAESHSFFDTIGVGDASHKNTQLEKVKDYARAQSQLPLSCRSDMLQGLGHSNSKAEAQRPVSEFTSFALR